MKEPKLLLLDEPLSNLDASLRLTMRSEIRSLQRKLGVTTILVTHDQIEATTMADRVICMSKGRIEQIGTADDLYHRPDSLFVASFIGSPPINLVARRAAAGAFTRRRRRVSVRWRRPAGEVVLGVRPEAVPPRRRAISTAASKIASRTGARRSTISHTPLGPLRALEPGAVARFRVGDMRPFAILSSLLFDAQTERRIEGCAGGAPSEAASSPRLKWHMLRRRRCRSRLPARKSRRRASQPAPPARSTSCLPPTATPSACTISTSTARRRPLGPASATRAEVERLRQRGTEARHSTAARCSSMRSSRAVRSTAARARRRAAARHQGVRTCVAGEALARLRRRSATSGPALHRRRLRLDDDPAAAAAAPGLARGLRSAVLSIRALCGLDADAYRALGEQTLATRARTRRSSISKETSCSPALDAAST